MRLLLLLTLCELGLTGTIATTTHQHSPSSTPPSFTLHLYCYTGQMLPVLNHFMQHPGNDYLLCRCRAIESAGILVDALGAQDPHIGPNIPGMMEVVLQGYSSSDSPDLRDYSHSMFGHVAKALGDGFSPWLQHVVPLAFASCAQEDGAFGRDGDGDDNDEEEADEDGDGDDEGVDDGSSSSEDEDGRGHFNVRTGECVGVYVSVSECACWCENTAWEVSE